MFAEPGGESRQRETMIIAVLGIIGSLLLWPLVLIVLVIGDKIAAEYADKSR